MSASILNPCFTVMFCQLNTLNTAVITDSRATQGAPDIGGPVFAVGSTGRKAPMIGGKTRIDSGSVEARMT